jgi:hypothetical protein
MSILLGALLATGAIAAVPPRTTIAPTKPATAVPPPAARPTREQVLAAVRAEWPKYDGGGKGRLTPLEFSTWVIKSHGGSVAARPHAGGIGPVSAMNASSTAFARADANHDGGITPDEMTRFLMVPPAPMALPRQPAKAVTPTLAPAKSVATVAGN